MSLSTYDRLMNYLKDMKPQRRINSIIDGVFIFILGVSVGCAGWLTSRDLAEKVGGTLLFFAFLAWACFLLMRHKRGR